MASTMRLIRHSLHPRDFWMLVWFAAYALTLTVLMWRR